MPSASKSSLIKSPLEQTEVDARWSALEAMEPTAWRAVQARVTVCLECLGPALLSDDELGMVACAPRCRRCRQEAHG